MCLPLEDSARALVSENADISNDWNLRSDACALETRAGWEGRAVERFFEYHKRKYFFTVGADGGVACSALGMPVGEPFSHYLAARGYRDSDSAKAAEHKYGANQFAIPRPAFAELLKEHALAPFSSL